MNASEHHKEHARRAAALLTSFSFALHTGDTTLLASDAPRLLEEHGGASSDPSGAMFGAMFVAEWLLTEVQLASNRSRADVMAALQQYIDEPRGAPEIARFRN